MACTSCSTSDGGAPKGCKNNGTCGTDSCNKLTVFDWLANMSLPSGEAPFDCVEVRFKNGRKEFFRNTEKLTLSIGDIVATEASPGHDVGIVTLTGELVKIQMKKKGVNHTSSDIPKVYRKASQKDIDIWSDARDKEEPMKVRARELAIAHKLEMKISDIEFQGDGSKVTFYYTANDRVDFRMLIKDYAREFSTRIEMKQVGFRQEASRLGGIGSCGRELCCSTWLTDFRSVNTSAARYQQLSLNPQKLAGQCGKLKCCLNYELDSYMEAIKDIPDSNTKLQTLKGSASHRKTDILRRIMWFGYDDAEGPAGADNWAVLQVDRVKEILEMNKAGNKPVDLASFVDFEEEEKPVDYADVVGQDSLTRMMDKRKKKKKKKKQDGDRPEGMQAKAPQSNQRPLSAEGNRQPREQRPQNQPKSSSNQPRREGGGPQQPKGPKPPQQNQQGQRPPRSTPSNNNQGSAPGIGGGQEQQRKPQPQAPSNPPVSNKPAASNDSPGQSASTGGRVRQIPPRTKPDSES